MDWFSYFMKSFSTIYDEIFYCLKGEYMQTFATPLEFVKISGLPISIVRTYLNQGKLPFIKEDKFHYYIHVEAALQKLKLMAEENSLRMEASATVQDNGKDI